MYGIIGARAGAMCALLFLLCYCLCNYAFYLVNCILYNQKKRRNIPFGEYLTNVVKQISFICICTHNCLLGYAIYVYVH